MNTGTTQGIGALCAPYEFRRYVYGQERAEGVRINNADNFEHAIKKAVALCPEPGTVLVFEDPSCRALAARVKELEAENARPTNRHAPGQLSGAVDYIERYAADPVKSGADYDDGSAMHAVAWKIVKAWEQDWYDADAYAARYKRDRSALRAALTDLLNDLDDRALDNEPMPGLRACMEAARGVLASTNTYGA